MAHTAGSQPRLSSPCWSEKDPRARLLDCQCSRGPQIGHLLCPSLFAGSRLLGGRLASDASSDHPAFGHADRNHGEDPQPWLLSRDVRSRHKGETQVPRGQYRATSPRPLSPPPTCSREEREASVLGAETTWRPQPALTAARPPRPACPAGGGKVIPTGRGSGGERGLAGEPAGLELGQQQEELGARSQRATGLLLNPPPPPGPSPHGH